MAQIIPQRADLSAQLTLLNGVFACALSGWRTIPVSERAAHNSLVVA
jgi:hypothetical protein